MSIDWDNQPGWNHEPFPDGYRQAEVREDLRLLAEEKETTLTFPRDVPYGLFYSDVSTTIKWALSMESVTIESVRVNSQGSVNALRARIPRTVLKFQSTPRMSDNYSGMVSYGQLR